MKCCNCGTTNDSSATFCRSCGKLLIGESVINKYPEFHFQPTTVYTLTGKKSWWWAIIPLSILFLFGVYFACGSIFYEGLVHYDVAFAILGGSAGIFVAVLAFVLIKKCYRKTKPINIKQVADYIGCPHYDNKYSVIVKDGFWGLYDTENKKLLVG